MPLSKGVCFGLLSLKLVLIGIALIDITIGASAIGIGIVAFLKFNLPASLLSYAIINSFCLLLAIASIVAIYTRTLRALRFYYLWKCAEVVLIPIFELALFLSASTNNNTSVADKLYSPLTHH